MANKNDNLLRGHPPTQFPHNDPTKGGRKPSIRNRLKELLEHDEGVMTVPKSQVKEIHADGRVSIILPTEHQISMRLVNWAMSKKGNDSLKAIQMIMEQIDGKPTQETKHTVGGSVESFLDQFKKGNVE